MMAAVSIERIAVPDQAPPGPGLPPWARGATAALAEALFSTHDGPPPAERLTWLIDELDHFFGHAGARARVSYFLCLIACSWLAPLLSLRPGSLASQPLPERLDTLERFERHPLGLALFGAKAILCILYYEHPDASREVGFDGSCLRGAR